MATDLTYKVLGEKGTWIFCAPIANLHLTPATNYEYKLDRVTFIDTEKLPRRRKRFGFTLPISSHNSPSAQRIFRESKTLALVRLQGTGKDAERMLNCIQK